MTPSCWKPNRRPALRSAVGIGHSEVGLKRLIEADDAVLKVVLDVTTAIGVEVAAAGTAVVVDAGAHCEYDGEPSGRSEYASKYVERWRYIERTEPD